MIARKNQAFVVVFGVFVVANVTAGTIALASGCTVLTNDGLPDDAGVFEGGEGGGGDASTCGACLSASCVAAQALCLTNDGCTGIIACGAACEAGTSCASDCACNAAKGDGADPERLHHAYTTCSDAKLATCCAGENRAPSTLPSCTATNDGGIADGGVDAGDADAGAPDASDASSPGPDACIACAAANCSAAVAACTSSSECGAFLACSFACTTASCTFDCASRHATGKVSATELATCTASNCQFACEL